MALSSLLALVQRYFEKDPVDAAHVVETMSEEDALEILKALQPAMSAEVMHHLPISLAAGLLQKLSKSYFKEIVGKMDAQQAVSVLIQVAPETRSGLMEYLEEKKKKQIQDLLNYPNDSAGRIMSTQYLAFHGDLKVRDAIQKIRELVKKGAPASYIYVMDRENHLVGVLNMRDMMLADSGVPLSGVMRPDVFTVDCFMDREKVAEQLALRKFFAAPVVDSEKRLLGVVKAEQLIEDVQEEATEDVQKMFGASGDERAFSPIRFTLKTRLPWLHVNLLTAFLAAAVVALFEDVIAKMTVLAVFLPVVAGQGGNAGAQSLAVVMRGLVMREIPAGKVRQLIFKETFIGFINGVVIGIVTAVAAWVWQGNPYLGLVVGLGMLVNLIFAGLAGSAIPIVMKAMGLDPAQCSNIILTTVTDVMGFFAFLGFAFVFQSYLF